MLSPFIRWLKGRVAWCHACEARTAQVREPGGSWVCQRCLGYC
jgi:hypothetical protein